jgi:neuron navigator 2
VTRVKKFINVDTRLQQLTSTAEQKDSELNELRRTIDRLRQAGADVGLIDNKLRRQVSTDSVDSCISGDESGASGKKKGDSSGHKRSGWLRNSFSKAFTSKHGSSKASKETTR